MAELDSALEKWRKTLKTDKQKKKITFSIPIVNVGSDLEIPVPNFRKSPGEKILVFIQAPLPQAAVTCRPYCAYPPLFPSLPANPLQLCLPIGVLKKMGTK
jgi:hypothetical protein